jgi:hypothetical protein
LTRLGRLTEHSRKASHALANRIGMMNAETFS